MFGIMICLLAVVICNLLVIGGVELNPGPIGKYPNSSQQANLI